MDEQRNGEEYPGEDLDPRKEVGPGGAVMAYREQPAPQAPRVSAPSAPVPFLDFQEYVERISGAEAVQQSQALAEAYDVACKALIGPNDVQEEAGREFKKKSAWRKLGRHFFISVREVAEPHGRWERLPHDDAPHFVAFARVEATAPWGQTMPGYGACSTRELRFYMQGPRCPRCGGATWDNRESDRGPEDFACKDRGGCGGLIMPDQWEDDDLGRVPNPTARAKAEHDCLATAETRAINRAISELIAMGEVSWEEVQGGDQDAYDRGRGDGKRKKLPTLDDKIGWGKHGELTWRKVAELDPDYAWWLVNEADRPPKAVKDALQAHLTKLSEEGAQDAAGEGSQDPADDPGSGDALEGKPGSGKYGHRTWREILEIDPGYLELMLSRPWGDRNIPEGSLLRSMVEAGLAMDEPGPPSWFDLVNHLLDSHGITEDEAEDWARLWKDVPDTFPEWTEEHAEAGARQLMRYGVQKVFRGVNRRVGREDTPEGQEDGTEAPSGGDTEPKPEPPPPLPPRLVKEARSVMDHAARHDVPDTMEAAERIEGAISRGDRDTLENEVESLKARLFEHMAGGGVGGPERETDPDPEPEDDPPIGPADPSGIQDDLPF